MTGHAPDQGNQGEALDRLRQHEGILVDFARVASEATELQRVLDLACYNVARATGVDHSKVLRYRHDYGDLLIAAGTGWRPGVVGHGRLGVDMQSPAGRSFQTRESVNIADINDDPNFRYSAVLREHGLVAVLNAPIAIDGVVWGVIEVDSTRPAAFDGDDERFLQAFGLILALHVRHRRAQDERERNASELAARIKQAETLLGEHNHRVRNYFQMILAILAERTHRAASAQVRTEYEEVMERVTAIALAHDQLTFKEGQIHINTTPYLGALCKSLERMLPETLRIEKEIEPLRLRPDRAAPLGLILNELLTNAIKYAAKDRPEARISVRFVSDVGSGESMLTVSDNGPGMGEARPGSSGLRFVRLLAGQISGRVNIDSSEAGTTVTLIFPIVE